MQKKGEALVEKQTDGTTDVLPSGVTASRAHTGQKSKIPDVNK